MTVNSWLVGWVSIRSSVIRFLPLGVSLLLAACGGVGVTPFTPAYRVS